MKRIATILLLLIFVIFPLSMSVFAQPTVSNEATCDSCGYCSGVEPVPGNWEKCRDCLYEGVGDVPATSNKTLEGWPTPNPDKHYTMIGCISTVPGEFASQLSAFFFSVMGGICFLIILYGAFLLMTAQGDIERLNYGKRVVYGAIAGLLFIFFSTFIIRFIACNVLKIPGFCE